MAEQDLLIEIGTEELPPKALLTLSTSFQHEIETLLNKAGLKFSTTTNFATPRRLSLIVTELQIKQSDTTVTKLGPALKAAFDSNGQPTKAAEGFARSCGVSVTELGEFNDGKVTKLFHTINTTGQDSVDLIPEIVNSALSLLPIPKKMRWGTSRVEFVRPVHWVVLLFGSELIPATILGVNTTCSTYGHRSHHPEPIELTSASEYETKLTNSGYVIPNFHERLEVIRSLIIAEGEKLNLQPVIDEELLNEVTALVEWPVAITGRFADKFLSVPNEALISSLKSHQKCFHLLDKNQSIQAYFISISNLQSSDPGLVVKGYEKVIGPRLADASFFYSQDQQHSLASLQPRLKQVIFQKQLGTLFDKSKRVSDLSSYIANSLDIDPTPCTRASQLAKCDLLTSMVGEFADLQGIMGYYYALNDNEDNDVAIAIKEQYLPRFSGDSLPGSITGTVLALAERIDTLVGLFSIGQPPTGSKDPFALRRAALGILRIIIDNKLPLNLLPIILEASSHFTDSSLTSNLPQEVMDFIFDRLRYLYVDHGISPQSFLAVQSVRPTSPYDFDLRIKAVSNFTRFSSADSLISMNKRVANILAKLPEQPCTEINQSLLTEDAEIKLSIELDSLINKVNPLLSNKEYSLALESMCSLHHAIHNFFDSVMVNTEDQSTRHNRQAILQKLRNLFLQIADISQL